MLVETVIQRSDLEIVPGHNGLNKTCLRLTIKHAKHHQVSRPIVLERTPESTNCPVAYICRYLHILGSPAGPLFIFADKSRMSKTYFAFQLQHVLHTQIATLDKCHSFCIGAGTTAATWGFIDRQVQIMGRWKSAAFRRYIRIPKYNYKYVQN